MPDEVKFGTSFFGFKKTDVNSYKEKILREFEESLKERDEEITALKNQCRDVRIKFEDIVKKSDKINEDRALIADVLIKAQEKADTIIDEAKNRAMEEKKSLDEMIEKEKEKLVDIKHELKNLKTNILSQIKSYEKQLIDIADSKVETDLESEPNSEQTKEEDKIATSTNVYSYTY